MQFKGNLLVAQAGGPTSVINNSLFGIIDQARRHSEITGVLGVANAERKVPAEFISPSGDFVTPEFASYLRPFIQGNISLNYEASLPLFTRLIRTKGKKEVRLR